MRKFKKYVEFLTTKIEVKFEEKTFHYRDIQLRYILKKLRNSDKLIIVFSSCTRKGLRARYNYMRTLSKIECNQLFILDDFSKDHRGSYYIGYHYNFIEESATRQLIEKVSQELNIKQKIFCGSSKGGWAALNFGLLYPDSIIISGGPQYFLATFLINYDNPITLEHIIGDKTPEKIEYLDQYLRRKVLKNPFCSTQRIYLHYSDSEHTYREDICPLIEDLKDMNYIYETDICHYTDHGQISLYFPEYLVRTVKTLLEN